MDNLNMQEYCRNILEKGNLTDYDDGLDEVMLCENFSINDLCDFLKVIDEFENIRILDKQNATNNFIYRGISCKNWKLEPSLSFNCLTKWETEIINEYLQLRPDEFEGIDSDFNLIAKMQHYGLPTRLIDFATNPLIALYFATCDNNFYDVDGKVYMVLPNTYDYMTNNYIDLPCSLYKNLVNRTYEDKQLFWTYFSLYHTGDNIYFKKPKYITERERRQESVFLIFTNNIINKQNNYTYRYKKVIFISRTRVYR